MRPLEERAVVAVPSPGASSEPHPACWLTTLKVTLKVALDLSNLAPTLHPESLFCLVMNNLPNRVSVESNFAFRIPRCVDYSRQLRS